MIIDFRTDAGTRPTEEMRKAMYNAEVGDDVFREDPSVNRLEETAAEMLGKEAALFVTSGTMGNQLAILSQTSPGSEILVEEHSHIFVQEAASHSIIAGVQTRPISSDKGTLDPERVRSAIRMPGESTYTSLLCLENTHNYSGGTIVPLDNIKDLYSICRKSGTKLHIDGARLFNAVVATSISVDEYAQYSDTVQICLCKGLGAPIGAILAGSQECIANARNWRKRLGGAMPQAGVIAAPALVALTSMVERLNEDHEKAKKLAEGLIQIPGITVELETVQTNIVMANVQGTGKSVRELIYELKAVGILATEFTAGVLRFVTHKDISQADIDEALKRIKNLL
ncbi:threonine aldolase family protein [Bacillus sp. 1NLA3E]|uniref:threonine aldolase family protein n=1 Tax=Bacillus sp. 1NLA3E TaxID=666686 RepID=UPI000247E824|nr:GntG family PLP-dependent aldolase [Bacillus sp. 1NLA3E]AGK52867.1 threonine aldolase [Bacillus sp. 1NLA3E]